MAKEVPVREDASVRAQAEKLGPMNANSDPEVSTAVVEPTASPEEHAQAMSTVRTITRVARVNNEPETFEQYHWQHAAASALHGWEQHAHHDQKPIQLSRADYEAALVAASKPVTRLIGEDGKPGIKIDSHEAAAKGLQTMTDYEPHPPALSEHKDKSK